MMDDNQARHSVLESVMIFLYAAKAPSTHAVDINMILGVELKNKQKRDKAIKYLFATDYLNYSLIERNREEIGVVSLTEKGRNAFTSEYFLSLHNEEITKRNNNRWMISTNVVLALGVFYSIFHDNFKCSGKASDKTAPKTEQINKKADSSLIHAKSNHVAIPLEVKDSLKIP